MRLLDTEIIRCSRLFFSANAYFATRQSSQQSAFKAATVAGRVSGKRMNTFTNGEYLPRFLLLTLRSTLPQFRTACRQVRLRPPQHSKCVSPKAGHEYRVPWARKRMFHFTRGALPLRFLVVVKCCLSG
jgi:hypothetical protein